MIDPNLYWSNPADQQPLIVRCGYPPGYPLAPPGMGEEGSITRAAFEELLEPLKRIRVPPCPGEEAFVCDGALCGFTAVLGSTSFSYEWHTTCLLAGSQSPSGSEGLSINWHSLPARPFHERA